MYLLDRAGFGVAPRTGAVAAVIASFAAALGHRRDMRKDPAMAIEMTYLAVYPAIAFTAVTMNAAWSAVASRLHAVALRRTSLALAWFAVILLAVVTRRDVPVRSKVKPVVSNDMFAAGQWARSHVPVGLRGLARGQ